MNERKMDVSLSSVQESVSMETIDGDAIDGYVCLCLCVCSVGSILEYVDN